VNTDPGGATQLLAAADAIAEETGQRLDTTYSLRFVDRATAAARERLGDAFEAEWQAGSELNLTDAVALALGEG